jgi:hypothetical protein
LEAVSKLGEANQDEGEERGAVPLVVEEDVQVVERVLVEEVRFVEEKHGIDTLPPEFLDMGSDAMEDRGRGGVGSQADGQAELAVEVPPTEGGVVTIGQSHVGLVEAGAQGAQDAGLAHAGLSHQQDLGLLSEGLLEVIDQSLLGGW